MPRVANNGEAVRQWYRTESDGSGTSTFDICNCCLIDFKAGNNMVEISRKLEPYNGDPEGDELEEGCHHPCYEESHERGEEYRCEVCDVTLREDDNGEAY